MSVVLAESGTAVGGTERVVWELATRLPAARYDVRVWLSTAPAMDEFAAALEERGIPVERIAEVDSRWDWKGMWNTFRRMRRSSPQLLHLHHVWPASDRYVDFLAGAAGIPHLVVTEHIVGTSHSAAQRALKRRELLRADAVTAVCDAVADTLVRDYGVDRSRLRVVRNGTDPPDEEEEWPVVREIRARYAATRVRPVWVCAARLEEQKGQDVLLEAAAEIVRRGLEFTLLFAGVGSRRDELEARAGTLGLVRRVEFLGQVDELGPLLRAADAVVLPSRWEGLPLTLLEAMARGRPVIASAVGGVPEVVEDRANGLLVPAGDAGALADALERVHRFPDAAAALGEEAARLVEESYTWDRVTAQFEAVYDDVLGLASFSAGARAVVPAPRRKGGEP
ncbi:MAG TPA: glycosyltransferase [Candidatus Udaeobacter sp.]|nr:glycosyltransferase [Candidatus Udaeobacter sp.]